MVALEAVKKRFSAFVRKNSLAVVPLLVAWAASLLLLPRSASTDDVPIPLVDMREVESRALSESAIAATRDLSPLGLALGQKIREFFLLEWEMGALDARATANTELSTTESLESAENDRELMTTLEQKKGPIVRELQLLAERVDREEGTEALLHVRAKQAVRFLSAIEQFRASGKESNDLKELGGRILAMFRKAGWSSGSNILLSQDELRVHYLVVWNDLVGTNKVQGFQLSREEQKLLHRFQIMHPTMPERTRHALLHQKGKIDAKAYAALENEAIAQFLLERIKRVSVADPAYPALYASAVVLARTQRGEEQAYKNVTDWLRLHPDGEWTLRARNLAHRLRLSVAP